MNLLIDIGHPGHVHLFKNIIKDLEQKNHKIWVTVKDIPIAIKLLKKNNIPFLNIGAKYDSPLNKALNQFKYNWYVLRIAKKNEIDIGIGTSITLAQISKLSKIKSIILDDDDDDIQPLFVKFAHPFCDTLLSPAILRNKRKKKDTVYYSGYHELAYLHPSRFKPDPSVLDDLDMSIYDPFYILRFNSFKAHHDIGVNGLTYEQKIKLINILKPYGSIYITTEREIEPELEQYKLDIPPEKIHSILYYSKIYIGDSQTMASESAVLGTPAIRCNSFVGKISYLEEQENKYRLSYGFNPKQFDLMIQKIKYLLSLSNLKEEWQKRRQKMLADKIDVTAFMVWFIESYPESAKIMKEDPDYQYNFK